MGLPIWSWTTDYGKLWPGGGQFQNAGYEIDFPRTEQPGYANNEQPRQIEFRVPVLSKTMAVSSPARCRARPDLISTPSCAAEKISTVGDAIAYIEANAK